MLGDDADLAELVPALRLDAARVASTAAAVDVPAGEWVAGSESAHGRDGIGLLVVAGLLVRRVGFDGRFGAELLGAGDVLRPWESDGEGTLLFETTWRVMIPTRMAVLDVAWATRMAPFPQVIGALVGRALSRSRRLATSMAIVQQPRLEDRLWMLFWELADRYGRMKPDGVHLELPLTHELLSHLAAARRPSVSGALTRLAEQGSVRRVGRSWVLHGDPPDTDALRGGSGEVARSVV